MAGDTLGEPVRVSKRSPNAEPEGDGAQVNSLGRILVALPPSTDGWAEFALSRAENSG